MFIKFIRRRAFLFLALTVFGMGLVLTRGTTISGISQYLPNRFDQMSDSKASITATHLIGFDITDTITPLGSIEIQYCANDPLPNTPCTAPAGFDATGVVLASQSGNVGFSISPSSTSNMVILTRVPGAPSGASNTYQLNNIINPNASGTYYIRLLIFASIDASGADTQHGGVAFAITNAFNVSGEVPPILSFCVGVSINNLDCSTATSYFINLGDLSLGQTRIGTSQFAVGTNAQSGYTVSVSGTTLTSGNNVITALTAPTASQPGNNQFGINLRANVIPSIGNDPTGGGIGTVSPNYNIPNEFIYNNGDVLTSAPSPTDAQKFTVSYIANVNKSQPAGIYATTLTYICLANF